MSKNRLRRRVSPPQLRPNVGSCICAARRNLTDRRAGRAGPSASAAPDCWAQALHPRPRRAPPPIKEDQIRTMSIGNHAFVALSSALMTAQFLTATQARGWVVRLMDREPIVFFSCLLGTVGCGMCVVVPPVRKALGMSTSQMDGAPDAKGH